MSEPRERSERNIEAFLSELIHDLRNLLGGVTMMLPRDEAVAPELALGEVTFRNVFDVLRKAEDYRDRLRPPSSSPSAESVELAPLLERAIKALRAFLRERDVALTIAADARVMADKRALRKILENALHVVSKHTDEGDSVRISVRELEHDVVLSVETPEWGAGVTAGDVFSGSFRNGLDCWVSRQLARSMGGELSCELQPDVARLSLTLPRP